MNPRFRTPARPARPALGALAVALVALAGCGQKAKAPVDPDVAEAIEQRREVYKELGASFKSIADATKVGKPIDDTLLGTAQNLHGYASRTPELFPPGTGVDSGGRTTAKEEIWTDPADFHAGQKALVDGTTKLQEVMATRDLAATTAQVNELAQVCKTCHDKYRIPE